MRELSRAFFEQGTKVNLFFINLPFPSLNRSPSRYIEDIVYEIENLSAKHFREAVIGLLSATLLELQT